jgi:hypothetical protein
MSVINIPSNTYAPDTRTFNFQAAPNTSTAKADFTMESWPTALLVDISIERLQDGVWNLMTGQQLRGDVTHDRQGNPLLFQSCGFSWGGATFTDPMRVVITNNLTFSTAITLSLT